MGFLPWKDETRGIAVKINPAERAAALCVEGLERDGVDAAFVPVAVSEEGIRQAITRLAEEEPSVVVALGRTPTGPRVERLGRVPLACSPARPNEETPWLLAPDATELAAYLSTFADATARSLAFTASDDAGAYYCDNLCVELVRYARSKCIDARFLHVTGVDDCASDVAEARIRQYARQARATVDWLLGTLGQRV